MLKLLFPKLFNNCLTLKKTEPVSDLITATAVPAVCLVCNKDFTLIPKHKKCSCGGHIHKFDSNVEFLRYRYLKKRKNITDIDIQHKFDLVLPDAIYSNGVINGRKPELVGYEKQPNFFASYKIDFIYYDNMLPMGWIAEEFKASEEEMDKEAKKKLKLAAAQHHRFGHFCYAYPCENYENGNYRPYKRIFVEKKGKAWQYKTFDEMFVKPSPLGII